MRKSATSSAHTFPIRAFLLVAGFLLVVIFAIALSWGRSNELVTFTLSAETNIVTFDVQITDGDVYSLKLPPVEIRKENFDTLPSKTKSYVTNSNTVLQISGNARIKIVRDSPELLFATISGANSNDSFSAEFFADKKSVVSSKDAPISFTIGCRRGAECIQSSTDVVKNKCNKIDSRRRSIGPYIVHRHQQTRADSFFRIVESKQTGYISLEKYLGRNYIRFCGRS